VNSLPVVGVHGVGNYQPGLDAASAAERLRATWAGYLSAAGLPVDLRMAYYAGFLHATAQTRGDGLDDLDPPAREMLVAWADHLDARSPDIAQATWSVPARMVVDRIARRQHLDPLVLRRFVAVFLREVAGYLRAVDAPARIAARTAVAETIRAHGPGVVIAHSLGSVITYEALWANPELYVDLLVTVGSPLGMTGVVYERLVPAPATARTRPPNVGRWVNIADPGDIVVVPRPFTRRFQPDENTEDRHIHWLSFHAVRWYLSALPTLRSLRTYAAAPRPYLEPT
jgi:hypothetical protein